MTSSNFRKSSIKRIFDEGKKFVSASFIAFFVFESPGEFTVIASKKVGNAVKRNRSRRRLKELVRLYIKPNCQGIKLVLIARKETSILSFSRLLEDCNNLIKKFV